MTRVASSVLFVLMFCWFAAVDLASAQEFYNQLASWSGVPCSYGPYTSQSGDVGCWGAGACYNGLYYPDVGWYNWWSCSPGNYVTVQGGSDLDYTQGTWDGVNWISYPYGLYAWGEATPYPPGYLTYVGWDEADCNGEVDYSGGYTYSC